MKVGKPKKLESQKLSLCEKLSPAVTLPRDPILVPSSTPLSEEIGAKTGWRGYQGVSAGQNETATCWEMSKRVKSKAVGDTDSDDSAGSGEQAKVVCHWKCG